MRGVAQSVKGWLSRKDSRPATWSISPLVSRTASIGECRGALRGQRLLVCISCWRRSGDALTNSQRSPSAETAIDAWVRHFVLIDPSRAALLSGALQFHCGYPPPAAEPRTTTSMAISPGCDQLWLTARRKTALNASAGVAVDFHADADFANPR